MKFFCSLNSKIVVKAIFYICFINILSLTNKKMNAISFSVWPHACTCLPRTTHLEQHALEITIYPEYLTSLISTPYPLLSPSFSLSRPLPPPPPDIPTLPSFSSDWRCTKDLLIIFFSFYVFCVEIYCLINIF